MSREIGQWGGNQDRGERRFGKTGKCGEEGVGDFWQEGNEIGERKSGRSGCRPWKRGGEEDFAGKRKKNGGGSCGREIVGDGEVAGEEDVEKVEWLCDREREIGTEGAGGEDGWRLAGDGLVEESERGRLWRRWRWRWRWRWRRWRRGGPEVAAAAAA